MPVWVTLLRGVNVGGRNKVKMEDLRAALTKGGFEDVRTYIQSGNCVFHASEPVAGRVETRVADIIQKKFKFRPDVLVLSRAVMVGAVFANPFARQGRADPKSVHLYFLAGPVTEVDIEPLRALAVDGEDIALKERVLYLLAPNGIGKSKLAAKIEAQLPVAATARNLRSAQKIAELARGM